MDRKIGIYRALKNAANFALEVGQSNISSVFGVLWVLLLESIFVGVWECLLRTYKLILTCSCIS